MMSRNTRRDRSIGKTRMRGAGRHTSENRTKPAPTISQRSFKSENSPISGFRRSVRPGAIPDPLACQTCEPARTREIGNTRVGIRHPDEASTRRCDIQCSHAPRRNANAKSLTRLNLSRFQRREDRGGRPAQRSGCDEKGQRRDRIRSQAGRPDVLADTRPDAPATNPGVTSGASVPSAFV